MAILPRTFNARTVKEERAVTDYIKNKIKDYPRIEDAFEACKWRLARRPEDGEQVKNPFFIIKSEDFSNFDDVKMPPLRVLYSFDGNEVIIYAVDAVVKD